MQLISTTVGLLCCKGYDRKEIKVKIAELFRALDFSPARGSKILLKPNLISVANGGLACTHPEVLAAAAEWFIDHGTLVSVGDSPAFGTAKKVMNACGIARALQGLPVRLVNFNTARRLITENGFHVGIAQEALDCDILVNLPKVKAHGQMLVSLAVKNLFGVIIGLRKPYIHACYGDVDNKFEELLVDLLAVLPDGVSLADGIVAMGHDGPISGQPVPLGLLAASNNPVAMDTALLEKLDIPREESPLWRECARRRLPGWNSADITFPLGNREDIPQFRLPVPETLKPVTFHPGRLMVSSIKRLMARFS